MPMSPDEREDFGAVKSDVLTTKTILFRGIGLVLLTVIGSHLRTEHRMSVLETKMEFASEAMCAYAYNKTDIKGKLSKPPPMPPEPQTKTATVAMMEITTR